MMENNVVEIENVCLNIKGAVILDNINFYCEKGKIYGLVGRNGSGKTMLMKCIVGFVKCTEGIIKVNNKVVGQDIDFPEEIGLIIETPGFIPYYSGFNNLYYLAKLKGIIDTDNIISAMEMVGLDPKLKKHVRHYSLGMRQRLGLAQAIMENPQLLVLDEPFNGLDNEGVIDMRNYLLKIKEQGTTIILSSHNKEDIEILCDEYRVLDKGKIIETVINDKK